MADLPWKDAIIEVLQGKEEPMHYVDIADEIAARELKTNVGATPSASVASVFSIARSEDDRTFERVSRGLYRLGGAITGDEPAVQSSGDDDSRTETGLVNAFGMYWRRDRVLWSPIRMLGRQLSTSEPVDFTEQRGVYLLHDRSHVVYVGRSMKRGLGIRLYEHTSDRLEGRWERFSWFGVYPVHEDGSLGADADLDFSVDQLIATMEALLIEGLEPPQNRKRGDDFRAVEFLQAENPEIEKKKMASMLEDLKSRI